MRGTMLCILVFILSANGCKKSPTRPVYPETGKPAPEIEFTQCLNGRPPGDFSGKTVVLEFWATWCGPCRAMIPHMNNLVEKFSGDSIVFFAMSDEEPGVVEAFMKSNPMKSLVVIDDKRRTKTSYGLQWIPFAFLIDRAGILRWHDYPGELTEAALDRYLRTGALPRGPDSNIARVSLPGFLDIRFGDPPDSVRRKILRIKGVTDISGPAGYRFHGGEYLGHEVDEWIMDFWKARYFFEARIDFKKDSAASASLSQDLEGRLERQFGIPGYQRSWRFRVQGQHNMNNVWLLYGGRVPVELKYYGSASIDSIMDAAGAAAGTKSPPDSPR